MMRKPSAGPGPRSDLKSRLTAVALSAAAGALAAFLLLCAFAALMSVQDLPHSAVVPLSTLSVTVGAFAAGYCCARLIQEHGLLWGLCCGTLLFLIALLCEQLLLGEPVGVLGAYKFVIYAAASMMGGVLGVNRRRKVR